MGRIKAVFLDRDGTINVDKGYVFKEEDFEIIPGSLKALRLFTEHGIRIFIITNQAGIAKGYYTEEDFHRLTGHMLRLFKSENISIEDVLYCPHHPQGTIARYAKECNCRKPDVGMIMRILERNVFTGEDVIIVGDKDSDIEMGRRAGIATYLVLTGYGKDFQKNTKADYVLPDLYSVAKHILGTGNRGYTK